MERFGGLNFCSFNPTEVFEEILSNCLGQKCLLLKRGTYTQGKTCSTLDHREKHKASASKSFYVHSATNTNGLQQISCDT